MPKSATCRRGHPWTACNTYIRPDDGRRVCRRCIALRTRKYYRRDNLDGWPCLNCTPRRPCAECVAARREAPPKSRARRWSDYNEDFDG